MVKRKLFTLTVLVFWLAANIANSQDRPNILWLTSEDNSARWLGCYGNEHANTPNLDRLATEGFQYINVFANTPVCAPQRCTWITGVLAVSMGTHHMRSTYNIPDDKIKLYPEYLKQNGYFTGNWKKTDYNIGGRNNSPRWDSSKKVNWQELKNQQPFFQIMNFTSSHESKAFGDVGNTEHDPEKTELASYHPDLPVIRQNYAHYHDAVTKMDGQIGEALNKLAKAGLSGNTIVVYNSDHGGVLPRSKRFLYGSGLHCPLIIRIPEKLKHLWPAENAGSKIDRLISLVDLPKTWLSVTGSEVPDVMQGKIFLGKNQETEREFHFAFRGRMDERIDNARAVCDTRYLYIRNYMPYVPWMQRLTYLWNMKATRAWEESVKNGTANPTQIRYFSPKGWKEELYDIQADPDNVNNLAGESKYDAVLKRMRNQLRQRQLEIVDAGLIPESDILKLARQHNKTIYDLVRDPNLYPLRRLIDAADVALRQDQVYAPRLRNMLNDPHVGIRYWAIVGCFLLGDQAGGQKAVKDNSDEIRAMAAWLLIRSGAKKQGLECLKDLIQNKSDALLTVLNIADWMGEEAATLVPAIKELKFDADKKGIEKYSQRMRDLILERQKNE